MADLLPSVSAISKDTETSTEKHKEKKKRKKIRHLVCPTTNVVCKSQNIKNYKKPVVVYSIIAIIIAALIGSIVQNCDGFYRSFLQNYRRHFYEIVHGNEDYCNSYLDTSKLFALIRQQNILHQDEALQQLEVAFQNDTILNSIAVVGGVGVGKSMWAQALVEHFPWRDNVHTYAWNTFVHDEAEKIHIIRMFVDNFSDCGRNLLIIDNLSPCDREVVFIVNKLLSEGDGAHAVSKNRHVVAVYIFNLNNLWDSSDFSEQYNLVLHLLPNTTTVNFKDFDVEEIRDCIHREANEANLTVSEENLNEIVKTINPKLTGCKNVRAKVLTHGTRF